MNRFAGQRRQLSWLLAGIFGVLACASALIVVEAAERLRYESFYAQRQLAESFASRVQDDLRGRMQLESSRPPTDYDFLVVSGERYVMRSPLSQLPPDSALPGVVGYFQVDADGDFSTPLLPAEVADPATLDLTEAEYQSRSELQQRIRGLLEKAGGQAAGADPTTASGRLGALAAPASEPEPSAAGAALTGTRALDERADDEQAGAAAPATAPARGSARYRDNLAQLPADSPAERNEADATTANRALFDELSRNQLKLEKRDSTTSSESKVASLNLRERFATLETEEAPTAGALPAAEEAQKKEARTGPVKQVVAADADQAIAEPQINVFESAVDPFQLARLSAAHLLLYRNVWLDDQRIVQGLIIEQAAFLDELIGSAFAGTALAATTDLAVVNGDDVISLHRQASSARYTSGRPELNGELLLKASLPAPADQLKLIFSISELPLGAGAVTLAWSSLVLALVLGGGFAALLLLGRRQIQLAEQQEDFVSAVSHELKTPLTAIRMYGEMLRSGWVAEDKRRTYYDYIFTESERLSRMIANVLTLARIGRSNHQQLTTKAEPVSVLLDQLDSSVASALDGAGLTLRRSYADDALAATVLADADAFLQVMINLVDNAIKFSATAAERSVEIGCALDGDRVLFRVRDFGPGVARDQMRKIFRLFYRAESELTRETVGTGIGLALVRELADQMNGSVDVVNRDPGAEFRLRLPIAG